MDNIERGVLLSMVCDIVCDCERERNARDRSDTTGEANCHGDTQIGRRIRGQKGVYFESMVCDTDQRVKRHNLEITTSNGIGTSWKAPVVNTST